MTLGRDLRRNNVSVSGRNEGATLVFAHGFGCDQRLWRWVAPVKRNATFLSHGCCPACKPRMMREMGLPDVGG